MGCLFLHKGVRSLMRQVGLGVGGLIKAAFRWFWLVVEEMVR